MVNMEKIPPKLQIPRNPQCDEIVKSIFNLNGRDIKVYHKLQELGRSRADELAKHLNLERSTVYRSLQKLTDCGICNKKTETLRKGGYYHSYECKDSYQIRKLAEKCIERWYISMKQMLYILEDEKNRFP